MDAKSLDARAGLGRRRVGMRRGVVMKRWGVSYYRFSGGSMRIGNRHGGSVFWSIVVMVTSPWAFGAAATERVVQVPLGGVLSNQSGDHQFGVYIPTRFGGNLAIKSSSGTVGNIAGPDGKPRQNGGDVGLGQQGWYTFSVTGATDSYQVATQFVQVGQTDRKSWSFYYWPTKSDAIHEPWAGGNGRVDTMQAFGDDEMVATPGGYIAPGQDIVRAGANGILETPVAQGDESTWFPNEYDDLTFRGADGTVYATPAPMLKYDQLFNSSARSWEAANSQNHDIQRWPGHCLGGAVASIMLNEPVPAPGSGLTKDELKALWAELGENHYNHQIGEYANEIPPGPPRPGYDECDSSVAKFHNMLEKHVRGNRKGLLANLRAYPPRGTVNEVWNHGISRYTATYHAIPGKGPRAVRLDVVVEGNSGSSLNGQDDKPRLVKYDYTLVYGLDGNVDLFNIASNDWISVGGEAQFAPLNILQVASTRWAGHNPYITEANVRSLDLANGGATGRFVASAPPQFRPVGNYEAGRAPMFANRTGAFGDSPAPTGNTNSLMPSRGLFRGFFGR